MHTAPPPRATIGFTLVELMAVIVILGIAAALVIPRMGSAASTKLIWAAQLLAADLQAAQSESMAHPDDPRVLVTASDATSYWIAASSDPTTPITNPIEQKPWQLAFGQQRGEHLTHVVMPKHNLGADLTLGFGAYGEPDQTYDAVFVLGCDSSILKVTVATDTGEVAIGALQPSGDLSDPLPGAVGETNTWNPFVTALLSGDTSAFSVGVP